MKIIVRPLFKLAVVLVYCAIIYFILRAYNIDYAKIKDMDPSLIRDKARALGAWIPLVYVIFYILRPLVLFPATILSILGGVIFGYFWGIVLVLLGAMASAVGEFFLSRHYFREAFKAFTGPNNLPSMDKAISKHGFRTVLLIRLIPNVAFDIQNFSLGASAVKFRDYFWGTFLGIIPINCIYVCLGYSFFDFRRIGKITFFLLIVLFVYFIHKYLARNNHFTIQAR